MATMHRPTGWNTWDFQGFNRLVYLRSGETIVAVEYAIWDETVPARVPPPDPEHRKIGKLYSQFRWDDVTRLGRHAPLGLPASLEFKAGGVAYRADAVDERGALRLTITPARESKQRVVFRFLAPFGVAEERQSATRGTISGSAVQLKGATWPTRYFVNIAEPYAVGQAGNPASILVAPPGKWGSGEVGKEKSRRASRTARTFPPPHLPTSPPGCPPAPHVPLVGEGALADAPAAMMQAICWNTLYDTRRKLVSSPVSRDWCFDWRGVLVFCWDTFLVATFMSYEAPELSRLNLEAVSAGIDELGFVPNYYMAHGAASRDRSMPCLGAYMIWKLFAGAEAVRNVISPAPRARLSTASRPTPSGFEHAWLAQVYPQLVRWHAYWMKNRNAWRIDGGRSTKTGLLSWGSNPVAYEFPQLVPYNQILQHTRQSAMYESGLDNSPLFDGVEFNEEKNCLELEDVALSSFYAMDCEALANIASYLGQRQDAARYRREHAKIARLINERLWDEEHGLYVNRHWAREGEAPAEPHSSHAPAGRYSDRWAPTSFFPLLAGVATPERAARMVREHLLNPREFWGEWVIPAIARSDPAYKDNDYWRGRIWGPFNFLVAEGLRRYRFDAEAAELAQKSLKLFMTNYRADGGVYENYNAETGQGADVWNAARLYHWGGLLAFIAMQELIDIEPNPAPGYLRVGSLDLPDAALQNVRLGGDLYDIQLDHGVHLKRAGQVILDCTTRAIVRVPLGPAADAAVQIAARESGALMLQGLKLGKLPARLSDGRMLEPLVRDRRISYGW